MENKNIPIVYSITLYKVIEKILFVGDTNSLVKPEERELPFNVKYKLQRNQDMLLKDYAFYESERTRLIKQFGSKDNEKVVVPPEKIEEFRSELLKSIRIEVDHSFKKLTPEEIENIKGEIPISCEEMNLFIAYMVEDKDLIEDLNSDVESLESSKEVEDTEVSVEA